MTSTDFLTPASFVDKWRRAKLSERAASQEHFLDLFHLLGQPAPAEHGAIGAKYAFEMVSPFPSPAPFSPTPSPNNNAETDYEILSNLFRLNYQMVFRESPKNTPFEKTIGEPQ